MLTAVWLILSNMLYSLQLQSGSFPKPLTAKEERYYLEKAAQGDLEARNILIERNLRLVAHIMNEWAALISRRAIICSLASIRQRTLISAFGVSGGAGTCRPIKGHSTRLCFCVTL